MDSIVSTATGICRPPKPTNLVCHRAAQSDLSGRNQSTHRESARPPAAHESRLSFPPRRNPDRTAPCAESSAPLRAPLSVLPAALRRFEIRDQIHQRIHRHIAQLVGALLNRLDPRLELFLRPLVAGLASAVDVEHRAAHVVVADLERAFALVRHVAIGAGHARARVDPLIPHLELRMLRFEHGRAGVGVRPVLELRFVVVSLDLFDLEPLGPRIDQPLLRSLEVILDVTLAADIGAHLLARRLLVDVVVLHALRGFERADAFDKPGARDPQLHGARIVTVDAGHRMGDELARFGVRHLIQLLEAFDEIAVPRLLVRHIDAKRGIGCTCRAVWPLVGAR